MKSNIIVGSVFFTLIAMPGAYAGTDSNSDSSTTPTVVEPSAQPSETSTPAETNTPSPEPMSTGTPEPTPSYAPGMAPGEHAGWVAVNSLGIPVSPVMVCTPEVCGQTGPGSWLDIAIKNGAMQPGARLVLQTLQDPVEAANSPSGIGNVAGYSGGIYNFENNQWTIPGENNSVYQIPLAYPNRDSGGNVRLPICIENCLNNEENTISTSTSTPEESQSNSNIVFQERRISVKPEVVDNGLIINKKIKEKIFKNQILIIAKKGNKKRVWTQQANGKIVNIKIPIKYLFWNISIRYMTE